MSNSDSSSLFSAADPALGYIYQVRCALLWSLEKLKQTPDFLVSIETLDDVTFDSGAGTPIELLQTKHHIAKAANLTDASPDLWKTLRIWFDGTANATIPATCALLLVTTSTASADTAIHLLMSANRDVPQARAILDSVANSSTNKVNANAYKSYLSATESHREQLLQRVLIIDQSPSITELTDKLTSELHWAARREHLNPFLERLEGWWVHQAIRQMAESSDSRIGGVEIEQKISDLREQFKEDSLPIDDDLLDFELDQAAYASHQESLFVRQLDLARISKRRIANAIRDYLRAFEQRSRWLRLELVVDLELHRYEKRLQEEWDVTFLAMKDDIGENATDDVKEQAAKDIIKWVETRYVHIRDGVTEPFVSRGSFHMLADEIRDEKPRVGWHPEFSERLEALLTEPQEST